MWIQHYICVVSLSCLVVGTLSKSLGGSSAASEEASDTLFDYDNENINLNTDEVLLMNFDHHRKRGKISDHLYKEVVRELEMASKNAVYKFDEVDELMSDAIENGDHIKEIALADDAGEALDIKEREDTFKPVPMPTDFDSYDVLEKDGFITLLELINVTGAMINVRLAFNESDKNGDGLLSKEEFDNAPWMLQGAPEYKESTPATTELGVQTTEHNGSLKSTKHISEMEENDVVFGDEDDEFVDDNEMNETNDLDEGDHSQRYEDYRKDMSYISYDYMYY